MPAGAAPNTLTVAYNDLDAVRALFAAEGSQIAAIIVEPVVGNMGCVPPAPGFLEGLREICTAHGALLVLDEVMTGFRVAQGGAQARFGVRPDLTTFGKVVGGGMPLAAFGGRADVMDRLAPLGPVYQAGTLSGNPVATAAGLAMLAQLGPSVYERLEVAGARLEAGFVAAAEAAGVPVTVQRVGAMWTIFFGTGPGCGTPGFCTPRPVIGTCPMVDAAVTDMACGCDGMTYASLCQMQAEGVRLARFGVCPRD